MKYRELIEAKIINTEIDPWGRGDTPITFYINPTSDQLNNIKTHSGQTVLGTYKHYRAFYLQNNTFMLWDAYQADHRTIFSWISDQEEYPDATKFVLLELEFYLFPDVLHIEFYSSKNIQKSSWQNRLLSNPTFIRMVKDFRLRWI